MTRRAVLLQGLFDLTNRGHWTLIIGVEAVSRLDRGYRIWLFRFAEGTFPFQTEDRELGRPIRPNFLGWNPPEKA